MTRGVLLVVLLAGVAGCARSESGGLTVADSAGVMLFVNPPTSGIRQQVTFADAPHTIIGGVRGELAEEFLSGSGYLTAVRMPDGRIVAHDRTHVKLFDADGTLLSIIGSAGDGPGEFRDIQGLCAFRGDSLLVTDLRNRVSVIGPSGTLVRQYPTSGWVVPNACFPDGTVLVSGARTRDASGGFATISFALLSTAGETIGSLPPLPASTYSPVEREVSYAVYEDELYVGDPAAMEVKVYDRAGQLLRVIRATDRPEILSATDPAGLVAEAEAGSSARAAVVRAPAGTPRPFYSRMRVDAAGRIWLRTADHRGSDVAWTVFGADGASAARVVMIRDVRRLPPATEAWSGQELIGFGPDEAIVLDRDELGAPRISFFRIAGLERGRN